MPVTPKRNTNLLHLLFVAAMLAPVLVGADTPDPVAQRFRPALATRTASFPSNVWVTDGLAKVQPTGTPGSQQSIDISAARNEFESFQVHVRAGANAIQLNVTASNFVNAAIAQPTSVPSASIFREAYQNVTVPSDLNGITGQVPDALIPVRDPWFQQQRNAFPFTVLANTTQSAWIDVYVPSDTPSGYYSATVTVWDGATALASIPVQLKVWAFTLPSTATLKSTFAMGYNTFCAAQYGGYAGCAAYPGSGGVPDTGIALSHVAVAAMFLDHRVSVGAVVMSPTSPQGDWTSFDSIYGPLLTGNAQTILPGAQMTSLQYQTYVDANHIQDWDQHFRAKGWLPRLFAYTCDEPPAGCTWAGATSNAQAFHAVDPEFRTLVTTNIADATANNLLGVEDLLAPALTTFQPKGASNTRSSYDQWLKLPHKEMWWYQACGQHESCTNGTPGGVESTWASYMVDASPVRNRVFQWMAYLYQIQGELYYNIDNWSDNPWDHNYFAGGNGEGVLFYPGTTAQVGGTAPIPIASLRLKLIRDGMEDYEYLAALGKAGRGDFATQTILSFITNPYTFNQDPAALRAARDTLGAELHRLALASSVALVQHTYGRSVSPIGVTFGTNVTTGNLIVVAVSADGDGSSVNSISDTQGNTYVRILQGLQNPGGGNAELWYAKNVTGGAVTVNVTMTGSTAHFVSINEFSGLDKVSPLDQTAINTNPAAPIWSSGVQTTLSPNELIFGFKTGGSTNAGAGFSLIDASGWNQSWGTEYKIASGAGAYDVQWPGQSYSGYGSVLMATFRAAGGTSPTTVTTVPAGLTLSVDGSACTTPCVFGWAQGSNHTIAATATPQAGTAGIQYVYAGWSDGGAQAHAVTAGTTGTYTASFKTQYFLTTAASPALGGTINPGSGWVNAGATQVVSATGNPGYQFTGFTGGALSGAITPQNLVVNGPATVTADFNSISTASIALVQHTYGRSVSPIGVKFGANVTTGNLIVVAVSADVDGASVNSMSDTQGNTYVRILQGFQHPGGGNAELWYAKNVMGGAITVNVTMSGSNAHIVAINEFIGLDKVNPLDQSAININPAAPVWSSGAQTTLFANELIFGFKTGGFTNPGAGFSLIDANGWNQFWGTEYEIVSGPGSYAVQWPGQSYSGYGAVLMATFKAAGGPSPTTVTTVPAGLTLSVDGSACTAPCVFGWAQGSNHTIAATATPQAGAAGTQFVYATWSDGGAQSHQITAGATGTYTAAFTTQYFLATGASPALGGTISPASSWINAGATQVVSATANSGYQFAGFTGGAGATLSKSSTPQALIVNGPTTVTANFSAIATTPIALVQHTYLRSVSPISLKFGANVTTGNLIVVAVNADVDGAAVSSISDSQGNTYVRILQGLENPGGANAELWYAKNVTGGAVTVSVTMPGSNAHFVAINEFSGLDKVSPLDQSAINTNPAAPIWSSGAQTTLYANELIFGFKTGGFTSVGAGFSLIDASAWNQSWGTEYKIVSGTGSYSVQWPGQSYSGYGAVLMATFK